MNLVIDIGNSRMKYALFSDNQLIEEHIHDDNNGGVEDFIRQKKDQVQRGIISAVGSIPPTLSGLLEELQISMLQLNHNTPLPFKNSYNSKETLGADRLAAIAGACFLYPSRNVLVIDAGTALTIDLKTSEEEYLGGNISPGINMRFRALHEYTRKLPLLEMEETNTSLGKNTREAIINGVKSGLIHEVNGYLETLDNKYSDLVVLVTGGDRQFFDNRLKKTIFVVSNLTLVGLNFILRYNAKN
ncbi:MAG: type III pantothenate kinase [Bacteroidales bacterium]|nr:type III pantothenate kinase [Bacteroidales bacterium]